MRTFVSHFGRPARARAGVSLLSVLLILVGIAFVAGWAIPAFFSQPDVTLDNAANLLVRDVRTAQNRAMWSGVDAYLRFDADGGGYSIVDEHGRPLERLGALGDWAQRYEEGGVFDGVRLVRVDAGPDRALLFDAKKRNWEGGEIELAFRGDTRVVRVTPRQGEVSVLALARSEPADDERDAASTAPGSRAPAASDD
ncbi:GspH/FimT family protein [Myxococcota bacterium]|nr:GspH/FimT family protein [Myxococcota bacterium]